MKEIFLTGKLHFFSEQGMEGGKLSIQDRNFIKIINPEHGLGKNYKVLDNKSSNRTGVTSKPEMLVDGSWVPLKGAIPSADLVRVTVKWNDGVIESERLSNTLFIERWSYDGLHFLKEDDLLKVQEPNSNKIICEGLVNEIGLKIFSSTQEGHFSQDNSNWKDYFSNQYTAELYR